MKSKDLRLFPLSSVPSVVKDPRGWPTQAICRLDWDCQSFNAYHQRLIQAEIHPASSVYFVSSVVRLSRYSKTTNG